MGKIRNNSVCKKKFDFDNIHCYHGNNRQLKNEMEQRTWRKICHINA